MSKGRKTKGILFKIGPSDIEIVNKYNYLGLYFTRSGSLINAKNIYLNKLLKPCLAC